MTTVVDYFALLGEARRPWLDVEALKQKFLAVSGDAHPDRVHGGGAAERQAAGERFSGLNSAYQCLRDPKERLRHLLALETGAAPDPLERMPAGATELAFEIGRLCREVDGFLAEKTAAASPLLQVGFFERGQEWTERLLAQQRELNRHQDELLAELKTMNPAWERRDAKGLPAGLPLERLEQIYRLTGYLARWSSQVRERIARLAI